MKKIISVVGARPNFMKVAPIHKAFLAYGDNVHHLICHTGQHYDENMSKIFFTDLGLPKPDFYLGVGSGSHAEQTARIMIEFEKILLQEKPDLVIVVGDVNSTIACCLVASKLGIKTAHVEAGLRSLDRTMPEEINRILTDAIADYLFVTEMSGLKNLKAENVDRHKIFFTGNVMIDSLIEHMPKADLSPVLKNYKLKSGNYILVTLHRPSNVDDKESLCQLASLLKAVSKGKKLIFPVHPRTRMNINKFGLEKSFGRNVILTDPFGYIDFLALTKNAELIITDSGGIQEESTYLGIQCITVRNSTERPVTVNIGTNFLEGTDLEKVKNRALSVLEGNIKKGSIPEFWDGKAASRIAQTIMDNV